MRLVCLAALAVVTVLACHSGGDSRVSCAGTGAAVVVNANDNYTFNPSGATVHPGQSVCWQATGIQAHTATADKGTFNGTVDEGTWYLYAFPDTGTFTYYCQLHQAFGMQGTITVVP